MNLTDLQQVLIMAARRDLPSEAVPYAFEKRIMARIANSTHSQAVEALSMWAGGLWRAAVPCSAIMVLLCAWSMISSHNISSSNSSDFSQEIENTLLAAADQESQPANEKIW
jgi:hypothetical protein